MFKMMWTLSALFIVSHMTYVLSHLNVTFSHLKFTGDPWKSDKVSVSCGIMEVNQDSSEYISYELLGYVILKSNQSHWKTIAKIFKSDQNQAYVRDPGITEATGSFIGDGRLGSHIKVTWKRFETSMYGKYRCEAILKETERKGKSESYNKLPFNLFRQVNQDERKKQFSTLSVDFVLTSSLNYSANDSRFLNFIQIEDTNNNITLLFNTTNVRKDEFLSGNIWNPKKASNDEDVLDFLKTVQSVPTENNSNAALKGDEEYIKTNMGAYDVDWRKRHLIKRSLLSIPDSKDLGLDTINDLLESMKSQNSNDVQKSSSEMKSSFFLNYVTSNETTNTTSLTTTKDHNVMQEDDMSETLKNMTAQLRNFKTAMKSTFLLKTLLNEYKNVYVEKLIYNLDKKLQEREKLFNNYSQEFVDFFESFSKLVELQADGLSVIRWPRGTYALLKSSSGCPSNPINVQVWREGFRKIHTESKSGYNKNSFSKNSHLALPINSTVNRDYFMNLHFCVKTEGERDGPPWPKGSYCINSKGNCTEGFGAGYFKFDEEDTGYQGTSGGVLPDNAGEQNGYLRFCCRSDGSPLYPIQLPLFAPFYLYRHGGRCQNVLGMSSREEYVYFDTEDFTNGDAKQSPHVDGFINNINITLCYYDKM